MGHATSPQFSFLDLRRPRTLARHGWTVRPARLHHAQARSRDRNPARARRSPGPDPRARSFARDAFASDRLGHRFARRLFALPPAPKRTLRSRRHRSKDLSRSRPSSLWRNSFFLMYSRAPRLAPPSNHRSPIGVTYA